MVQQGFLDNLILLKIPNIKKRSVKADIEVGLSPMEELVQDSLEAAMKASEALGNDTLTDQIGNTITYFTREFVVGNRTD